MTTVLNMDTPLDDPTFSQVLNPVPRARGTAYELFNFLKRRSPEHFGSCDTPYEAAAKLNNDHDTYNNVRLLLVANSAFDELIGISPDDRRMINQLATRLQTAVLTNMVRSLNPPATLHSKVFVRLKNL